MENKLMNIGKNSIMDNFVKTDDILKDMCGIIESSQKAAYQAVNIALVQRNWLLGYRIASEELQGEDRAKYGAEIIKKLSKELTAEYGKGYTKSNLYTFYSFCFLGHITECYYRSKTPKPVVGMRRKLPNKPGVFVLYREIFLLSIITVCFRHRKKSL